MPDRESTARPRSTESVSPALGENVVSCTACFPKPTTAIRSPGAFAFAKVWAAAVASSSEPPAIEREVSIASTTLLAAPRLTAVKPVTGRPSSVSFGASATGACVTIETAMCG